MKVVVLRSYAANCVPLFEPLRRFGCQLVEIEYVTENLFDKYWMVEWVADENPDWVFMIGVNDAGVGVVPPTFLLKDMTRRWPVVMMYCDGSEIDWYKQIEEYSTQCTFALHVNIDGVARGPITEHGITTLCPIDDELFVLPTPWEKRIINAGFCGGWSAESTHSRAAMTEALWRQRAVQAVCRPFILYDDYRRFLCDCKIVWNHASSGSDDHLHVKARIVEATFAGALVMEQMGSPLDKWFTPGVDYITWHDPDSVVSGTKWAVENPEKVKAMIAGMRAKMVKEHSARAFWTKVCERIGRPLP
jgi:hypothetical protein